MKKGDARREELLATAERLFYTKGYEKTSVQDIIDEMNFSKGGFYHHFDSKLSVLTAICEQRAKESCAQATRAVRSGQGTAVDKLNSVLSSSALLGSGQAGFVALLIQVAYREDGALMREKMKDSQIDCLTPVMESILREGVATREFFVEDISTTVSLLLRLFMQFTDEIAFLLAREDSEERFTEGMVARLRAYRGAIERVLMAPFGSIVLFEAKELQLLGQSVLRNRIRQRADAYLTGGK